MVNFLILLYLVVLTLLTILFIRLIVLKKVKYDLVFFLITNFILSFSFIVFLFYYKDYLYSLINILFLLINTIFLSFEIKTTYDKCSLLSFPYLIYIMFLFYLIIDLYLMHL